MGFTPQREFRSKNGFVLALNASYGLCCSNPAFYHTGCQILDKAFAHPSLQDELVFQEPLMFSFP
jgi:hypothetical protein